MNFQGHFTVFGIQRQKTIEVRNFAAEPGSLIFLAESWPGKPLAVHGSATVSRVDGPLNSTEWEEMRPQHRVQGDLFYGERRTFAWHLTNVSKITKPWLIKRKRGAIGTQFGSGW